MCFFFFFLYFLSSSFFFFSLSAYAFLWLVYRFDGREAFYIVFCKYVFFLWLYAGFSFSFLSCILFYYSMYVRFLIFFPFPSMPLICFYLLVSSRIPCCFLSPFSGWDRNRNPVGEIAILFPLVFRFGSSSYISSRGRRC